MDADAVIVFDADDTLWRVEHLYDEARDAAAGVVAESGFDPIRWSRLQKEIDLRNASLLGVAIERFPLSSVQAYEQIAAEGRIKPSDEVAQQVRSAAESVFVRRAPLVPGAVDVLTTLASRFRLALLTKGDEGVQRRRIADSGLGPYFERIDIVREKGTAEFVAVLAACRARADRSWSVGNSLPSDINPALRSGMSAVWIKAEVWSHETREVLPAPGPLLHARSLEEVPRLLGVVAVNRR